VIFFDSGLAHVLMKLVGEDGDAKRSLRLIVVSLAIKFFSFHRILEHASS
jgi:hypothetical protein